MGTELYYILRPRLTRGAIPLLPDFLVPAVSVRTTSRSFSRTSKCESRVGSAPLSIPLDVNMRVLEPPKKKTFSRCQPLKTVEVEGPRGLRFRYMLEGKFSNLQPGKMTLPLPEYMSVDHDEKKRKAVLKIDNRQVRKHREMWGMLKSKV